MTLAEEKIINGLIARDESITKQFFFSQCRPLIYGIIRKLFKGNAEYDELVNDFLLFLLKDDAYVLRSFKGESTPIRDEESLCMLFGYLRRSAWNFFCRHLKKRKKIGELMEFEYDDTGDLRGRDIVDTEVKDPEVTIDSDAYLNMLANERTRKILKMNLIEGLDFEQIESQTGLSKDVLYNIKSRGLRELKKVARHGSSPQSLCSIICEQFVLDAFGIHKTLDELSSLARNQDWLKQTGIALRNLGRLSLEFGLNTSAGYGKTISEISELLSAGKQVIVAIDGGELTGDPLEEVIEDALGAEVSDHCVVVLTATEENVCLFDPSLGDMPLSVSTEHFLDAWKDSGYYRVAVGK